MIAPNQLIVLGMHRSGTSCVTRILSLMGAYCGQPSMLTGANDENPKGFFERRDIRQICDRLLHSTGADWWKVSDFSVKNIPNEVIEECHDVFQAALTDLNSHLPWVIKEPRLCLLFPIFRQWLTDPICIHVHRNPLEVARSLRTRNGFSISFGLALRETYHRHAISASTGLPHLCVSYNDLMSQAEIEIPRLHERLTSSGVAGLSLPAQSDLHVFVDRNLYRQREQTSQSIVFALPTQAEFHPTDLESAGNESLFNSESLFQSIDYALRDGERLHQQSTAFELIIKKLENKNRYLESELSRIQEVSRARRSHINQLERDVNSQTRIANLKSKTIQETSKTIQEKSKTIQKQSEIIQKYRQELLEITSSDIFRITNLFAKAYGLLLPKAIKPFVRSSAKVGYHMGLSTIQLAKGILRFNLQTIFKTSKSKSFNRDRFFKSRQNFEKFHQLEVDVIVCVHNSLEDVISCLRSVVGLQMDNVRIIAVDDGSDEETRNYLSNFFADRPNDRLIVHQKAKGYTCAANAGLKASTGDYVVLLNSDTIVTDGWLEKLLMVGESDPAIGIVGPLSNAASWQSIPEVMRKDGKDWSVNPIPSGLSIERMNQIVDLQSNLIFPRVPLLNGFCYAIKRSTIEKIGYLDEENFPKGYGEENDYSFRAADAGFSLAIATHCYIYHSKSRSYTHERRKELARLGGDAFNLKHGKDRVENAVKLMKTEPTLKQMRSRTEALIKKLPLSGSKADSLCSVLFLLPVPGGSGGAHSVVQEATGLRKLGVNAQIAMPQEHRIAFEAHYFDTFPLDELLAVYGDETQLLAEAKHFDIVVATIFTSIKLLDLICQKYPNITPAYYAQDYEPLFELSKRERQEALSSYTRVPNTAIFAKTQWLQQEIESHHDVRVFRVTPSLDLDTFFEHGRTENARIRITAMVRLSTPRRAPFRTLRILQRIAQTHSNRVKIQIFGSSDAELLEAGVDVAESNIDNHGLLTRLQVADLLRNSDIFVDLSDYQAFGRTGLEAMACGTVPILPIKGGAREYAVHDANALLVDTSNEDACEASIQRLIDNEELLGALQQRGLETVKNYSIEDTVYSELILFLSLLLYRESAP
ncbi:MAG: glycosyltransferase [Synechococcus sp.]